MWRSAICSDGRPPRPAVAAGALGLAAAVLTAAVAGSPARAQETLTQREALRLAFPEPAEIGRETAFLEEEQIARVRELAGGVELKQGVVTYYVGRRDGEPLGVAYFDAHRVRTLREVLMIVVAPDASVDRVEVLRFDEPPEYRAPEGWLRDLEGRRLSDGLARGRGVTNITGATLTSRAVERAVRRTLALHRVISPLAPEDGEAGR